MMLFTTIVYETMEANRFSFPMTSIRIIRQLMHPGIHAKSNPDKAAYIMAATGKVVTYRELDDESNRAANLLRSLGLKSGDTIALFAENHPRYHQVLWAAQRSGLYYTAISSRLTAEEVAYIVNDSGAKVLITTRAMADVASQMDAANLIPGSVKRYMMDGTIANYKSWEDAVGSQPTTPIADETEGAAMLYSSGTTGKPKGVKHRLTGQPLGAPSPIGMLLAGLYQATPEMIYLSPAPLYHSAPLQFTMAVHRIGGTVIVMEHFDAEQSLALDREVPGDACADGADNVHPDAQAARADAQQIRSHELEGGDSRGRALSDRDQGTDDRMVGAENLRILCGNGGQRVLRDRQRAVAAA